MVFVSKVQGNIEYEEKDKITLRKGILGFENLKEYILVDLNECEPFKLLQSLEDENTGFIVVSPFEFFNDYEIKLSDEEINKLDVKNQNDIILLTTVTLNSDPKKITTNLKAPIIINISNNLGEQIILDNLDYKIKHLLIEE
ncbi:flagellar assembly protein FliW [Clostridium sp. CMCC3677]|uniref:flagellar assembly protein FliW n=1 Tax=Clostridium sp. CMCC3677 TaxID=2949963 RepID=UPI0013F0F1FA|nr:flagellar assembly protein FliW [Clostridium sp. CMCC3677]NFG60654.1 flagellar assembly protein FliW [Clostridium botulinum]NFQ10560.1 flagellar assembly protein FliW [Clostridium botulinum]